MLDAQPIQYTHCRMCSCVNCGLIISGFNIFSFPQTSSELQFTILKVIVSMYRTITYIQ